MLKQRTIFIFWLPLALSWFLMAFEHPWVQGVIGRLPDTQRQLAAFGLMLSLIILIESPIIMFLGTSAALSRNRQAFRLLWRYMMTVNVYVTITALIFGFTPLLDWWLGRVVGVEPGIIDAVRPGIRIMTFWPAVIGYRRFHQGVMIRNNHTRPIGYGTIIRLTTSAGTAVLLGTLTPIPGTAVGAAALFASATVEMIYVMYASRHDVRKVLNTELSPDDKPLTYPGAFKFHMPLALTSVIMLLVRPVIERGIAATPNAEPSLAAWAVVFSVIFITRSGGMAWQEAVISLSEDPRAIQALRRFTWIMGAAITVLLGVLAFTPLISLYIGPGLGVPENVQPLVIMGAQVGLFVPLLTALQSYLRGLLMRADATAPIYGAMMVNFAATVLVVWGGVTFTALEGVVIGSLSLTLGFVAELALLWWALSANQARLVPGYAGAASAEPA